MLKHIFFLLQVSSLQCSRGLTPAPSVSPLWLLPVCHYGTWGNMKLYWACISALFCLIMHCVIMHCMSLGCTVLFINALHCTVLLLGFVPDKTWPASGLSCSCSHAAGAWYTTTNICWMQRGSAVGTEQTVEYIRYRTNSTVQQVLNKQYSTLVTEQTVHFPLGDS